MPILAAAVVILLIVAVFTPNWWIRRVMAKHGGDRPDLPKDILAKWKDYPAPLRNELVNTLAARKPWAVALLKAMEAKTVDRTAVTDNVILKMQAFNDGKVNKLETTIMIVLFGMIIYFLGMHG